MMRTVIKLQEKKTMPKTRGVLTDANLIMEGEPQEHDENDEKQES
jgi:hypothetical protein